MVLNAVKVLTMVRVSENGSAKRLQSTSHKSEETANELRTI